MEEYRIGVYICWCGTNIAMMVDVEAVVEEIKKLPNVTIAKDYKYMCSDPGQDLIVKDIKEHHLNRIVVAACSPRMHEPTFRKALENAGLNPYFFEMANIREQVSWVHTDRIEATRKAKGLVAGAVKRVVHHKALNKRYVDIHPATLIIGAGVTGMSAALEIADSGQKVHLVEQCNQLGGMVRKVDLNYPYLNSSRQTISQLIKNTEEHPGIQIYTESKIDKISGYIGNFRALLSNHQEQGELEFGNILIATGLKSFDPSIIENYGYKRIPNVITSADFEKMLYSGLIHCENGREPGHIAIIHCVGSRNENYHPYCSRTCCMTALKYINQISSAAPECNIYDIYADMRAIGKDCEELYASTSKKNVMFLMFDQQHDLPVIKQNGNGKTVSIEFTELLSGESIHIQANMVVLMTAVESQANNKEIAHLAGISTDKNGFFIEKHPKLDPVATTTEGVYIAGTCQSPKDIPDSIVQAKAAAARILATIAKGKVQVEVTTAQVNEDICCGCQCCSSVCPYSAISYNDDKKVSEVNEILCKGCGTCASACPSGAIVSKHFTDNQILSQITGVLEMQIETA